MTTHMKTIDLRQREIIECVEALRILLHQTVLTETIQAAIELEIKRIERYAQDTLGVAITYSESLLHTRREKRRRHRQNTQRMKKLLHNIRANNYFYKTT